MNPSCPKISWPVRLVGLAAVFWSVTASLAATIPISELPLFGESNEPPLMMMVMSRDEQLFYRAYTDYSDLNGDSVVDSTYQNAFEYQGYFDPNICYTYATDRFVGNSAATNHQCNGMWSGNFLNWLTMSRFDMLRYVFYGGYRSTDTATQTVLERSYIPFDAHAWAKVYSGADINRYTPYSTAMTFCNTSFTLTGPPVVRAAQGIWSDWSATEFVSCYWKDQFAAPTNPSTGGPDSPPRGSEFTVRVEVCRSGTNTLRESFCRAYGTPAAPIYKPIGLLQEYGESASSMRFGLLTGSFSAPRSGGVLRRNIGQIAGNGNVAGCSGAAAAGNEIDLNTGQFCTPSNLEGGIIATLNRIRVENWNHADFSWGPDCLYVFNRMAFRGGYTILRNPGPESGSKSSDCRDWGNPVSEMYAEALRYIGGEAKTAGFTKSGDLAASGGLPALATPAWKDPYRPVAQGGSNYCAASNVLLLSTGLGSFDSDEVPSVAVFGTSARALTDAVGAAESISGQYLVGRVGDLPLNAELNTHEDICTAKNVTSLSSVKGVCPEVPHLEGSYLVAGLAHKAFTTDLRPGLTTSTGTPKPADAKNNVRTFSVSLAENLPSFSIVPPGSATGYTLTPLCQSAAAAVKPEEAGWNACRLSQTLIGPRKSTVGDQYVYGRDLENDGLAGSYTFTYDDMPFGSGYDKDVVAMMTFCVGAKCAKQSAQSAGRYDICWGSTSPVCNDSNGKPSIGATDMLVRAESLSANSGNAMLTGFIVTGAGAADGPYRLALRPGFSTGNVLSISQTPPANWTKPTVMKFSLGTGGARKLENPLFYSAKYGSFNDINKNNKPDPGEWEKINADGTPSKEPRSFFQVRDPGKFKTELRRVFSEASAATVATGSPAPSSPRFTAGATLSYQVSYKARDWTGEIQAYQLAADGTVGSRAWSASEKMPTPGARKIFTAQLRASGTGFDGAAFQASTFPAGPAATALLGDLATSTYNVTDLVAFLRGDRSKEMPAGPYRKRGGVLGDIVTSTPAVVSRRNLGYSTLPASVGGRATGAGAYAAFVQTKSAQPVLFVGANDGMMHGFAGHAGGGQELFGYVPAGVISKLHHLAKPDYLHRYYADASALVGDAYIGRWTEVLLSSIGAGGRGVYALDVTGLGASGDFAGRNVLWEFNDKLDADMGQLLERPQIALLADGRWSAVFGNGFNSQSGRAILYIRNLADGTPIAKLDTGAGSVANPNAMTGVAAIDSNGDRVADTIYGGDYQGNLWKFTLGAGGSWSNPLGTNPLFRAVDKHGHRQPITGGIDAVPNPLGGVVVLFGTGRYLDKPDADPAKLEADGKPLVNSIYGIWDRGPEATSMQPTAAGRATLLRQQRITAYTNGYRASTSDAVGYYSDSNPSGRFGWFVDLEFATANTDALRTERVLTAPAVILGTALFNTFRPQTDDACRPGGVNAVMEFDALSGGANYTELVPAGGTAPPPNASGTDLGIGPPQGEPNPVVSMPNPLDLPSIGCDPRDPACDFRPPQISGTKCLWMYPNSANKAIQAPMPCGRISWRQVN